MRVDQVVHPVCTAPSDPVYAAYMVVTHCTRCKNLLRNSMLRKNPRCSVSDTVSYGVRKVRKVSDSAP